MFRAGSALLLLLALSLACLSACSTEKGVCGPGLGRYCTCPNGDQGVETCQEDGMAWGTCVCQNQGRTSPDRGPVSKCSLVDLVSKQEMPIVAVLMHKTGIVIVRTTSIEIQGYEASDSKLVYAEGRPQSAAFNGRLLAVADLQAIRVYGTDLKKKGIIPLKAECAHSILSASDLLICSDTKNLGGEFRIYDLNRLMLVATTGKNTHPGHPVRWVPGTNQFVSSAPDGNPSRFENSCRP